MLYFSHRQSIDDVNHLIAFEANHLHSALRLNISSFESWPAHEPPRAQNSTSYVFNPWNACWFFFFVSLLLPSDSLCCGSLLRLTFLLAEELEINIRKRKTGIWSADPWSGKLLCWPLDHATPLILILKICLESNQKGIVLHNFYIYSCKYLEFLVFPSFCFWEKT